MYRTRLFPQAGLEAALSAADDALETAAAAAREAEGAAAARAVRARGPGAPKLRSHRQTGCAAKGPALYIYTPLETTRPVAPEASTRPDLLLLHDYTPLTHTSALRPDRLCRGRRAPLR